MFQGSGSHAIPSMSAWAGSGLPIHQELGFPRQKYTQGNLLSLCKGGSRTPEGVHDSMTGLLRIYWASCIHRDSLKEF